MANTISGSEPPKIDVTGKWRDAQGSTFFSWGEGFLRQEQNKINGTIGDYNIRRVVSGKIVYLVFLYGGTCLLHGPFGNVTRFTYWKLF